MNRISSPSCVRLHKDGHVWLIRWNPLEPGQTIRALDHLIRLAEDPNCPVDMEDAGAMAVLVRKESRAVKGLA